MSPLCRGTLTVSVLCAAAFAGWYGGGRTIPPGGDQATPAMSPAQIYALSFDDAAGARQSLAQWREQVLVINFWATWCPPCLREIPDFAQISLEYADRGVQFVGLGIDSRQNIARFAGEERVPYPLLVAGTGSLPIMAALGNDASALPFTLIVDRHGQIRLRRLGPMNGETLRKSLDAVLAS